MTTEHQPGSPVTAEQAHESHQRLVDHFFGNPAERPRDSGSGGEGWLRSPTRCLRRQVNRDLPPQARRPGAGDGKAERVIPPSWSWPAWRRAGINVASTRAEPCASLSEDVRGRFCQVVRKSDLARTCVRCVSDARHS